VPVAWKKSPGGVTTEGVGYWLDWMHFQVGISKAEFAGWRTGVPGKRAVLRSSCGSSVRDLVASDSLRGRFEG
jgi:hypothetical protein